MRTHLVVLLAEPLHHSLLLAPIGCWWLGRLLLQRAMHPLMPPVLLRMPSCNPLRHDSQLHPPHRQARQPGNGSRCKRRPIVGSDRLRHAILAKHRFKTACTRAVSVFSTAWQRNRYRLWASVIVSGSILSPSPVRNQPLKSAHHTRFGPSACASGSV